MARGDVTSGYHQCSLDELSALDAGFVCEEGVFAPRGLFFGLKCAPSHGHIVSTVLQGLIGVICGENIDDILQ